MSTVVFKLNAYNWKIINLNKKFKQNKKICYTLENLLKETNITKTTITNKTEYI